MTKPAHDPRLQVLFSDLQALERKETFLGLWQQSRALVRPRWVPYVVGEMILPRSVDSLFTLPASVYSSLD